MGALRFAVDCSRGVTARALEATPRARNGAVRTGRRIRLRGRDRASGQELVIGTDAAHRVWAYAAASRCPAFQPHAARDHRRRIPLLFVVHMGSSTWVWRTTRPIRSRRPPLGEVQPERRPLTPDPGCSQSHRGRAFVWMRASRPAAGIELLICRPVSSGSGQPRPPALRCAIRATRPATLSRWRVSADTRRTDLCGGSRCGPHRHRRNVSAHGTPAIGGLAASESAAANLTAARADAAVLLGEVSLPAGATPSASEPAGDDGRLASSDTGPATPNLVDDHAWWVLPGAPAQALTYIRAHPTAGSTLTVPTSGSTRGVITSESSPSPGHRSRAYWTPAS